MTETIRTRDGTDLEVRPIAASDRDALQESFLALSAATRYRRFLRPVKRLGEAELTYLCDVDHHDREALLAVTPEGHIVGVARYIRLAERPGIAEVAVTISDSWQGRGVGTSLLRRLMSRARDEGIHAFTALCLASNRDMRVLFDELGERVRQTGRDREAIELEIELPVDSEHLAAPAVRAVAKAGDLTAHPSTRARA